MMLKNEQNLFTNTEIYLNENKAALYPCYRYYFEHLGGKDVGPEEKDQISEMATSIVCLAAYQQSLGREFDLEAEMTPEDDEKISKIFGIFLVMFIIWDLEMRRVVTQRLDGKWTTNVKLSPKQD